jgi:epoxyqueuosine reductase
VRTRKRTDGGIDPPSPADLAQAARRAALALGFHAAGICDLAPIERGALRRWLDDGYGATMTYVHRQAAKRDRPARIVPGAQRALVVLERYHPGPPPAGAPARVARYAWGEDYHCVLGERLTALAEALIALGASREATRAFVDSGPVPERELARRAGLGWLAKNTMLISPQHGSYTFIGSVLTDLELAVDEPFATDHCGTCRACLDACPTGALPVPRRLDARRCISYLTIERRGSLEPDGALIGDWLFGCDLCQEACPWNDKFAAPATEPRFAPRAELVRPDLDQLEGLDDAAFDARYADTAFARPGRERMIRNARLVRKNSPQRAQRRTEG